MYATPPQWTEPPQWGASSPVPPQQRVGRPPPPPPNQANLQEAIAAQWADLRRQVVDRALEMNIRHSGIAWAAADDGKLPLSPNAVAYHFYDIDYDRIYAMRDLRAGAASQRDQEAERTGDVRPGHSKDMPMANTYLHPGYDQVLGLSGPEIDYFKLHTATRVFLLGDEIAEIPALLRRLHRIARAHLARGPLDVRSTRHMSTNCEPSMQPGAYFLGLTVSTLDAPGQPWSQSRAHPDARLKGQLVVPGRTFTYLADRTHIIVDRPAQATGYQPPRVRSIGTMTSRFLRASGQPWTPIDKPHPVEYEGGRMVGGDLPSADTWRAMYDLFDVIAAAEARRQALSKR